ncbi:fibronectin type III domain-containing protein [bacterium]|jgi:hypothetical protein|nr:fibronectin type III domain-containing protein [bacterium]
MIRFGVTAVLTGLILSTASHAVDPEILGAKDVRKARFQRLYSLDSQGSPLAAETKAPPSLIEKKVEHAKLDILLQTKVESMFGVETKVFEKEIMGQKIIGYMRLNQYRGLNNYWKSDDSLDLSMEWELVLDWPVAGRKYYYGTSLVELKRTMAPEKNMMILDTNMTLGMGQGWHPPQETGLKAAAMRKFFNNAMRWVLGKGIESTFKVWGKKVNEALKTKLGPILPPVNGEQQEWKVETVEHEKDRVVATMSPLQLNLKKLLANQLPADIRDRVTVKNVKVQQDSTTLYIELKLLAAPGGLVVTSGNGELTVTWDNVTEATGYNFYYSTSPWMAPSTKIQNVSSPYTLTGLANGTAYYISTTSLDQFGESAFSPTGNGTPAE